MGQAYLSNKFDCPRACGLCHTATAGEPCHEGVTWAMLHGIKIHPEWYPELAQNSSFEAFQEHLHEGKFMNCPRPCPAWVIPQVPIGFPGVHVDSGGPSCGSFCRWPTRCHKLLGGRLT